MALVPPISHVSSQRCLPFLLPPLDNPISFSSQSFSSLTPLKLRLNHRSRSNSKFFSVSYRYFTDEDDEDTEDHNFDEAVALFNGRDYYKCHDYLEALWHEAEDPTRTLIHGILQCAVGFHHLFNQNHKGAMMELGEGICKLRKMEFQSGPFHQFEKDISAVLDFIYQTQIELAACGDDMCVAMDQSERSYQLLGEYGAGQRVYDLELANDASVYIVFYPQGSRRAATEPPRVKLPKLKATTEHLVAYGYP
ncbi:hypothetical protein QN277_013467 [Acacia crassicarpa]|uniref:DUF309 domain-containing protein n=1 Tax=Acacia crassicarpa TaxID=499986 RepID=A0AAE1N3N4_9FABA|nr:hypothetical protein QN277_013467 [Acacia crassicarpa]